MKEKVKELILKLRTVGPGKYGMVFFAMKCTVVSLVFITVLTGFSMLTPKILSLFTEEKQAAPIEDNFIQTDDDIYDLPEGDILDDLSEVSHRIDPDEDEDEDIIIYPPPEGVAVNKEIWLGQRLEAKDFVTNIVAQTEVIVSFKSNPNWQRTGKQDVELILTDEYDNSTELSAELTIKRDEVPPVITGAVDFEILVGDTIMYRRGVSARDNIDGEISFRVNSSAVSPDVPGVYPVTYTAVDSSGNEVSVTINLTIVEFSAAVVYALADSILSNIITSDMTLTQKARAIHRWLQTSVTYTSATNQGVLRSAYNTMKNRRGDCFSFYAAAEVLLTRVGVANMRISRVGGATPHYWNLINVGTGWYHFDSMNISSLRNRDSFMFTSVQAKEWNNLNSRGDFFNYDRSLYPPIVGDDLLGLEPLEPDTPIDDDIPDDDIIDDGSGSEEPVEPEEPDTPIVPEEPQEP